MNVFNPHNYSGLINLKAHYISKRSQALRLAEIQLKQDPYRLNRICALMDVASVYREEIQRLQHRIAFINGTL